MPGFNLMASFLRWQRVRTTRRELMALSDTQLHDIGLTRYDINDVVHGSSHRMSAPRRF